MAKLKNKPPRYIILMNTEKKPFPRLKTFVLQNYTLAKTIQEANIYTRFPQL